MSQGSPLQVHLAPTVPAPRSGGRTRSQRLVNVSRLQRVLALLPAAGAAYGLSQFPVAIPALAAGLLVFGLLCWRYPGWWLLGIPLLLPVLDLTPWSGRLYFQEFDLFLLVALACCLWHGQFRAGRHAALPIAAGLALAVFTISYLWSLYLGANPFPPLGVNSFTSYYSNYNALRVARGFLWALIFLRPLSLMFRRDADLARRYLTSGVVCGLFGVALAALWERGVWHDLLYGENRYARLHGLLDFTTPYRVTGLFSSMHTGGESIDGYLALAWPCAMIAILLTTRRRWLTLLGALTLPLALYTSVATFSRASYLALAISMLCFGMGFVFVTARRAGAARAAMAMVASGAFFVVAALAFHRGGVIALGASLLTFGSYAGACFLQRPRRPVFIVVLALGSILAGTALAYRAQVTSKWVQVDAASALPWALALAVAAALLGIVLGRYARRSMNATEFGVAALVLAVVASTIVPATFGFRMESRFSTASGDLKTRADHWRDALSLLPDTWQSRFLGVGLGTFPRLYLLSFPDRSGGIGVLHQEDRNTLLRLTGGKDLKISQRVDLPAFATYQARLDYRLDADEANLRLQICRRQIIHPSEYNGQCRTVLKNLHSTHGEWQHLEHTFEIDGLGDTWRNLARAPLIFELTNRREYGLAMKPPAIVDVDNVELVDALGRNRLANGDFSAGMDRWFSLFDFNHLPWHIKNMWVDLYFEQGAVGVASFLLLLLLALRSGFVGALAGDLFSFGVTVSLIGFASVGLVGTLLDEPRIMLLYFVLCFALLANGLALRSR